MSEMEVFYTSERSEWRRYLAEHFETSTEIWFVFPMKESGEKSLSYIKTITFLPVLERWYTGSILEIVCFFSIFRYALLTIEIFRIETVARQITVIIKMGERSFDFFVSTKTMAAKEARAIRAFSAICHSGAEKN